MNEEPNKMKNNNKMKNKNERAITTNITKPSLEVLPSKVPLMGVSLSRFKKMITDV